MHNYIDYQNNIVYCVPHRNGTNTFDRILIDKLNFSHISFERENIAVLKKCTAIMVLRDPLVRFISWYDDFTKLDEDFDNILLPSYKSLLLDRTLSAEYFDDYKYIMYCDSHTTPQFCLYHNYIPHKLFKKIKFMHNDDISTHFGLEKYDHYRKNTKMFEHYIDTIKEVYKMDYEWFSRLNFIYGAKIPK